MQHTIIPNKNSYKALTIVSAMVFGEEQKDQDRARWYESGQRGCVCDGVTASPNSTEAAELIASFAPVMFNNNPHDQLRILCDLLLAYREENQLSHNTVLPKHIPDAMKDMLQKVVQEKWATAFQTTIVAVRLISNESIVVADVIKCGDSAFFAFTPTGELLSSSLAYATKSHCQKNAYRKFPIYKAPKVITFGPGDEILVRIKGRLREYKGLVRQAGIKPKHVSNWLVCRPIDSRAAEDQTHEHNLLELHALTLTPQDQLLVPESLYGKELTSQGAEYRVLRYSSTIRRVLPQAQMPSYCKFDGHGSITAVLPDHFYSKAFDSFQDTFPCGTQFILASDGFYGAFSNWAAMWQWLKRNKQGLKSQGTQQAILSRLHHQLHAKSGDDDISFIWIRPDSERKWRD